MANRVNRRRFLQTAVATGSALAAPNFARVLAAPRPQQRPAAKADSVIFIWLPGGIAQADTWDTKRHTPFESGMKGSELLGTCESIPTSVDDLRFGAGLENMAEVMRHGTLLRSLTNETKFGA
ncbi:MAG TPA: hypothetical protein VGJ16_03375, partial [Pirellulales bacterium]